MMVRLAGIEPTTPWFVAKYSIQLSYSRKATRLFSITLETRGLRPEQAYIIGGAVVTCPVSGARI